MRITSVFILTIGLLNLTVKIDTTNYTNPIDIISLSSLAVQADDESSTCKWQDAECGDHTYRETCLVDGDGNACTCGSVTRSCS